MKTLFLDSGPIISLATNNLLWLIEKLPVNFAMTEGVKRELVDKPLETRRFKFEALQVKSLIEKKKISLVKDDAIVKKARSLLQLANSILSGHNHNIQIVQIGEMETLAAAMIYKADAIAVDERITRTLLENPKGLKRLMERRLHMHLKLNAKALRQFQEECRHIFIIRSIELATVAFERGLLDKYIVDMPNARRELLEGVLWGIKLNGASVTDTEIDEIVKSEKV